MSLLATQRHVNTMHGEQEHQLAHCSLAETGVQAGRDIETSGNKGQMF